MSNFGEIKDKLSDADTPKQIKESPEVIRIHTIPGDVILRVNRDFQKGTRTVTTEEQKTQSYINNTIG